ncbi:phage tail protein [Sphingomonas cavernae]|uniref:Uncharacterized protein n=1 Tax=Sphingomonas cavernae TaxID=2320861 RepID=A0A418WL86_9SPHN|nr:phage tail protein [Sphingomonas cavernae]RJF90793.1 hypothetical protein D3876_11410 [Sphingomonas cavernae]
MATLVLTAVGTIFGGPMGAAIGAMIGQQIDQNVLFKPKNRQGPRLGDLAVQTSSYGSPIPVLFGTMRVAGTVIWATDLREERTRSGGGKGRPKATNYSYSASFAVALSARAIIGVRRIWADGKLLRGAGGDFKTATGFRVHAGGEGQAADPLIAAAEGIGGTPAYRGMAYAVFEDFQLADYGNRIPSLTFEVEADPAPVPISTIADVLSDGAVGGTLSRRLGGYAASGDSVRGAIETLARAAPLSLSDAGDRLELVAEDAPVLTIAASELGAAAGGAGAAARDERSTSTLVAPGEIALSYYEPARDYQAGLHRARRPGNGRRVERIELPAALDAGEAKAMAEANLARGLTGRVQRTARLSWRHLGIAPSQIVAIDGVPGLWRVAEAEVERMAVALTLVRHRGGSITLMPPAEPGRPAPQPDLIHGPTVIQAFELPELGEALASAPRIMTAAAGSSAGWRGAALAVSHDAGFSWEDRGSTAAPATMGAAVTALAPGDTLCFDDIGAVEIALLNSGMQLADADDARLTAGANLALLGNELIQFGSAEPIGVGRYRLRRLLRGRRGTEFAVADHSPGERFILIEPQTLAMIDIPASMIGGEMLTMASGVGDDVAVQRAVPIIGSSVRPPSPVALDAIPDSDGGYRLTWIRRSRLGWRWVDSIDAPLGEEKELYRITVLRGGAVVRVTESEVSEFDYPAAAIAADSAGESAVTILVAQVGAFAPSCPAAIVIPTD